jgi:hypothetical protein
MKRGNNAVLATAGALLAAAGLAKGQTYVFEDLGAVTSEDGFDRLPLINDFGGVVCNDGLGSPFLVPPGTTARATLGVPAGMTLPAAFALNNAGIMAGSVYNGTAEEACAWLPSGTPILLTPVFGGLTGIRMTALNDALYALGVLNLGGTTLSFAASFATSPPGIAVLSGSPILGFPSRMNNANAARSTVIDPLSTVLAPARRVAGPANWPIIDPTFSMQNSAVSFDLNENGLTAVTTFSPTLEPASVNVGGAITIIPTPAGNGGWMYAAGACDAMGGTYYDAAFNLRGLYLHPQWTAGVAVDANTLPAVLGTALPGTITSVTDMGTGAVAVPNGVASQVWMVGYWTDAAGQVRLFRARQCLTDIDGDGVPATPADFTAFGSGFFPNDINCDGIAPDPIDFGIFGDLITLGLGC